MMEMFFEAPHYGAQALIVILRYRAQPWHHPHILTTLCTNGVLAILVAAGSLAVPIPSVLAPAALHVVGSCIPTQLSERLSAMPMQAPAIAPRKTAEELDEDLAPVATTFRRPPRLKRMSPCYSP
jgi:hypothetical protein